MKNEQTLVHHHRRSAPPRLHDDVLWRVLNLISSIDEECTTHLSSIRCISQVCHGWRQLVLQSSSIWANVIDLQAMAHSKVEWWEEVMRRTGTSELSISGFADGYSKARLLFLFFMKEWHRVRKFDVSMMLIFNVNNDPEVWDIFWTKPAPSLEYFKFMDLENTRTMTSMPVSGKLFANHAPKLRYFYWPTLDFDYHVNWATYIKYIDLPYSCSALKGLEILDRCPNIEGLHAHCSPQVTDVVPHDRQQSVLQNLRYISTLCNYNFCLDFLLNICPSPGCRLDMYTAYNTPATIEDGETAKLRSVFLGYMRPIFLNGMVKSLEISMSRSHFSVITAPTVAETNEIYHMEFRCLHGSLPSGTLCSLLHPLASSPLDSITDIKFMFKPMWTPQLEGLENGLAALVSKLLFVQVLWTSVESLEVLDAIIFTSKGFPQLKVLKLSSPSLRIPSMLNFQSKVQMVHSYLKRRLLDGIPVTTLDMLFRRSWSRKQDWRLLEDITGLTVVWQLEDGIREYVCGSGSPDSLLL